MIPKAYCLTLRQTPGREMDARAEFKKAGIEVQMFHGIDGVAFGLKTTRTRPLDVTRYELSPGYTAMVVSHYMLWEMLTHVEGEEFLIFEDDVIMTEDFIPRYEKHRAALPDDWQMAYLGWASEGHVTPVNDLTIQQRWFWGTHAYLVKREALEILLSTNHIAAYHIDTQIIERTLKPGHLKFYNFFPSLISQKTIEQRWASQGPESGASRLNDRTRPPYIVHRQVNEFCFNYVIGDFGSAEWYDVRENLVGSLDFCKREGLLKPGDCAVDAGAHQGLYALIMSRIVGDAGRVIAFEPFHFNYLYLDTNCALNCPKIERHCKALSNQTGIVDFDPGSCRLQKSHCSEPIHSIRLDDLQLPALDFIKIDVEGSEIELLKGAQETFKQHRPSFVLEFHYSLIGTEGYDALMPLIDWSNYQLWAVTPHDGVQPWKPGDPLFHNADIFGKSLIRA
jgi:FkbM family methyltransferase